MTEEKSKEYMANNLEIDLINEKYSKNTLKKYLNEEYGLASGDAFDNPTVVSGYGYLATINGSWGCVDIYYLMVPSSDKEAEEIFVFEVNIEIG